MCLATRGDARPERFVARKGSGYALESLRKATAAPGHPKRARRRLPHRRPPRAIDYVHTKGMYGAKTQFGIYECDGATLTLSTAPPGEPRPTDFAERGAQTATMFRKRP